MSPHTIPRVRYFGRLERVTTIAAVEEVVYVVEADGAVAPLDPGFDRVRHSPDGFSWGYAGSGPAQLAWAILRDYYRRKLPAAHKAIADDLALRYHQGFKFKTIAPLAQDAPWTLSGEEIAAVLINLEAMAAGRSA